MPDQFNKPKHNTKTAQRIDFRGGVSRQRRQNQNEVYYCENARFNSDGSIEVRDGQLEHVSISATGNIEELYVKSSDALGLRFYSIQRSGDADDDCYAGVSKMVGESFGKSDYASIAEYKGVIFFSNGETPINYHEPSVLPAHSWGADTWGSYIWGSSNKRYQVSGTPTPPKGKHMLIYKDRMYIGGADGNLYWSNVGLFTTLPTVDFPTLNFQAIGGTNDPITGLVSGEDFLIAFTNGSYHIMTGTPDDDGGTGDMDWQVFDNIGVRASRSITSQGRKVPFIGTDRRIYMLEGTVLVDLDPLDRVKEYLTSFSDNVLRAVSIAFNGDELWVSVPIGYNESSSRVLVYSITMKNWTVFTSIDGFALYFSQSVGKLFVGKSTSSEIYELDNGDTDPGEVKIAWVWISRQEVLETLRKKKKYELLSLQLDVKQSDSIAVEYALDNSQQYTTFGVGSPIAPTGKTWGEETWGTSAWGGISLQNKLLRPVSGSKSVRGTEIKIKLSGNVSPGTRFLGYELEGEIEPKDTELT